MGSFGVLYRYAAMLLQATTTKNSRSKCACLEALASLIVASPPNLKVLDFKRRSKVCPFTTDICFTQ